MSRKRASPPTGGRRATWGNRILHGRAGMLRFTARETIAKRFGIPVGKVEVYHPSSLYLRKRIFEFIEKMEHDPERNWLLTHRKIWPYVRIRELAPAHSAEEIRRILLDERKNFRDGDKRLVHSSSVIAEIIRKNDLRPNGSPPVRVRKPVFRKNLRPLNTLTATEQEHMAKVAFEKYAFRKNPSGNFFDPELIDFIREKILNEARRFPFPEKVPAEDRLKYFRGVVNKKMKFWLIDGLRATGPYTRRGKPRRPIASSPLVEEKPASPPVEQVEEIPPALLRKLSPREIIIVEMLLQGAKRTEIARRLHLTGARVSQIVKKLPEKI